MTVLCRLRFLQPLGAVVTLLQTTEYLRRTAHGSWAGYSSETIEGPFDNRELIFNGWEAFERRIGSKEIR